MIVMFEMSGTRVTQIQKTPENGTARFLVPEPQPTTIWFGVSGKPVVWLCGAGYTNFAPNEVISHGGIQKGNCKLGKSAANITPKSSEVVLFCRPQPWWVPLISWFPGH